MQRPVVWLGLATGLAFISVLVAFFVSTIFGLGFLRYVPVCIGFIVMCLCWHVRRQVRHKIVVFLYVIFLAPFAFGYPALIAILHFAMGVHYDVHLRGPIP